MPRNHFYNRRFASRAPVVEERRLRRLSAQRRGKTRRRSTSRTSRARCFHLASRDGAGPPCGHPASGGLVLDGTLPASGRSATTLVRCTGGRASAALSARGGSAEIDPLTPFAAPGKGNAGAPDFQSHGPFPASARQCADLAWGPGAFHRTGPTWAALASGPGGDPAPLAGGAFAARVHRCSRTSTRPSVARCSRCA